MHSVSQGDERSTASAVKEFMQSAAKTKRYTLATRCHALGNRRGFGDRRLDLLAVPLIQRYLAVRRTEDCAGRRRSGLSDC